MTTHDVLLRDRAVDGGAPADAVPTPPEEILPRLDLGPARTWDWVFTAYENVTAVTGGIGTYHRLLLADLAATGRSVLVLTRACNAALDLGPNVTLVLVDELRPARSFNFVGDDHDRFSLHCHFAFRDLHAQGHRFRFVEFSDYGVDGFYPLRARACGIYDLGHAAVRLHSPDAMLIEDNGKSYNQLSNFHRDRVDREMSAYEDCDTILYGGEAMRERVTAICRRFGLSVEGKMRKCPHPYPLSTFAAAPAAAAGPDDRQFTIQRILATCQHARRAELEGATLVGLFGRIEYRKGQYQMFWTALEDPAFVEFLRSSPVHFLIAGHNVLDHHGHYRLGDLYGRIHQKGLQNRFHFTGRVPQEELARFSSACAGFVFPSIFENYPNALLEVLGTCKPVAISVAGCMPEIARGFADVHEIDFNRFEPARLTAFLEAVVRRGAGERPGELALRRATAEARNAEMLGIYAADWPAPPARAEARLTVGFVVPIYEETRFLEQAVRSAQRCMEPGDELIVVDDASGPEAALRIDAICAALRVRLHRLPVNSGPAAARRAGAEALSTHLVQFCDGDDVLDAAGVARARTALARDPSLSMVVGIMSCFQEADHCWVPRNGHLWTATRENYAHSGAMGRRDAMIRAMPEVRLTLNEDWLANLRLLAAGAKCRMIPEITYHYRRFGGTRSTQNSTELARVHGQILQDAMQHLEFGSAEQNARLKILLAGDVRTGSGAPSLQTIVQDATPLRYKVVDALFVRLGQSRWGSAALVRGRQVVVRLWRGRTRT